MTKKWKILFAFNEDIAETLETQRGIILHPPDPHTLTPQDVGMNADALTKAVKRIKKAITGKESIVVYADYDADGITAAAIMWETLHKAGAQIMPYIPHRTEEGYGLSIRGIDRVIEQYHPTLIITVDHGITAHEKVEYLKSKGIDVIVTDHHVKPEKLPDCTVIQTTDLCGAGVAWFVAKEIGEPDIALAAIGTIADMVPLTGVNRSIVKFGLAALNQTKRIGLLSLMKESGLEQGEIHTFDVSHALAPRLNAMGRLVHAMDALRLLCTNQKDKAEALAHTLALTNKERQTMTVEMTAHALQGLSLRTQGETLQKLLFVAHESYNQGVIGLIAGKLVEEHYRPAIVLAKGELVTKGSARSITGFNIVEAIRTCADLLIDVGGHPMAAGFTVETKNLPTLQNKLESLADQMISEEMLIRELRIDMELPLDAVTETLWNNLKDFEPYGFGNPEPVFATRGVVIQDARAVGSGKHLKMRVSSPITPITPISRIDCIAFNFGNLYGELKSGTIIDIAYSIDMNEWNGNRTLQLKIKDIQFH